MKLYKANEYLQIFNKLFERTDLPFNTIEKLCDLSEILSQCNSKYLKLKNKLVNDYYIPDEKDKNTLIIANAENLPKVNNEMESLNNLEKAIEKQVIEKINNISVKELSCLREFFIFE